MIVKIDEDGQIKLPETLMEKIQVSPGDELEVSAGPSWLTVSRRRERPLPQKPIPKKKVEFSKVQAFRERIAADPKYAEMEDLEEIRNQMYYGNPLRN